ncbi:DUF6787 family protein [Maribellus mangrovi]|uniref:DUF6787 family protein n=1 Tax=Maribellus mangrovi TaxID=3133146 RepID=UPI0030EB2146
MFERLKKRWNIASNTQVAIILVVFAITGSATVYLKNMFFTLIGITAETDLVVRIPVYIASVLIIYNILLLIIGFVFGQFRFFWAFEKKFFSRFAPKRKRSSLVDLKTKA